ncbi:30S ribosomal protein S17e [Candidatus Woesearchaeota archaeon]|nr:30S ribosomal protein S17e [Candidatus Woesearchaeota archaeon]
MGRIKTRPIKAISMDLLETYRENFSTEYEHNKAKVMEFTDVKSKKLRNIIAGYITRMVKAEAQ